jgi:hypothetical protein
MRSYLTILLLIFITNLSLATTIENSSLRVAVDIHQNEFTITEIQSNKTFIQQGQFISGIRHTFSSPINETKFGNGQEILITHDNDWQTSVRLFNNNPFVFIHTYVVNNADQPFVTPSLQLFQYDANLGLTSDKIKSYGSGGLHPISDAPGSFSFNAIVVPESRNGIVSAFLTHEQGSGVFETMQVHDQPRIQARIDFGHYQIQPYQSRNTETIILGYFDDARLGLEAWADAVAKFYEITLPPQPAVYCTWYHAGASNEEKLIQNAKFSEQHLKPYGLNVFQIDDKWQKRLPKGVSYDGPDQDLHDGGPIKVFTEANQNFTSGMKYTASQLQQSGFVAGIWFMPFVGNYKNPFYADKQDLFAKNPDGTPFTTRWSGTILDLSNPKTQAFVKERVKRIADWGYNYFKLDGMHTGAVCHNVYVNSGYSTSGRWQNKKDFGGGVLSDPLMTNIQAYRKGLDIVCENAPEAFILGCNVSQNMRSMGAAFDKIDAMRIGPDNGAAGTGNWGQVKVGAWHGSNLYFLNKRVWHNDPDPVYVRPSNPLNKAQLMVSWVAVTSSMLSISYQFSELPPERLDLLKRCMPGHNAEVRPVDIFEKDQASIWFVDDSRSGIDRYLIGLFNWNEKEEETISYDLETIGLNPTKTYIAFEYWTDQQIPPIQKTLNHTIPPASCRVLALREKTDVPQVISTSRHITQGIIDIHEEKWDENSKTLSGTSKVVKGDPYEIRIALPSTNSWKVKNLKVNNGLIGLQSHENGIIRIVIEPNDTQEVTWLAKFE